MAEYKKMYQKTLGKVCWNALKEAKIPTKHFYLWKLPGMVILSDSPPEEETRTRRKISSSELKEMDDLVLQSLYEVIYKELVRRRMEVQQGMERKRREESEEV